MFMNSSVADREPVPSEYQQPKESNSLQDDGQFIVTHGRFARNNSTRRIHVTDGEIFGFNLCRMVTSGKFGEGLQKTVVNIARYHCKMSAHCFIKQSFSTRIAH